MPYAPSELIMHPLITIIVASNRPDQLKEFFDNITEYTHNISNIEICAVIDDGDLETENIALIFKDKLNIKIIHYKNQYGMYMLNEAYNEVLFKHSNNQSYFVVNFNDEVRIKTYGWDNIILRYKNLFADDIYRLKISNNKYKQYFSLQEALFFPEHYSVITRRALESIGGFQGFWGSDSVIEGIFYYMNFLNYKCDFYYDRSIPIPDINLNVMIAGINLKESENKYLREKIIRKTLNFMQSFKGKIFFLKKATILKSIIDFYIEFNENPDFIAYDDNAKKAYGSKNNLKMKFGIIPIFRLNETYDFKSEDAQRIEKYVSTAESCKNRLYHLKMKFGIICLKRIIIHYARKIESLRLLKYLKKKLTKVQSFCFWHRDNKLGEDKSSMRDEATEKLNKDEFMKSIIENHIEEYIFSKIIQKYLNK